MSDTDAARRSTPQLITDVLAQAASLLRTEVRLVRAEIAEKVNQIGSAAAMLGLVLVLSIAALVLLLEGVVAWLAMGGWQPHVAAFLVGGVVAVIAVGLLLKALNDLKASSLKPDRTLHQLNKDLNVAKEQVQ